MSKVDKALRKAFEDMESKKWDRIYVAVDLHGTIIKENDGNKISFYDKAIPVLKAMCDRPDIVIILWTGAHSDTINKTTSKLWNNWRININYVNENPEVESSSHYDFGSGKFYYNVCLDDRCGFEQRDWSKIMKVLKHHPYKNKNNE